jgi:hypothetical protein
LSVAPAVAYFYMQMMAKFAKHILAQNDSVLPQNDLDAIEAWLGRWLVSLNVSKCKAVGYSYHSLSANKYYFTHKGEQIDVQAVNTMKDLGVSFLFMFEI